jgi:hypothetical protein
MRRDPEWSNFFLVLGRIMVKVNSTMKRLFTLLALLAVAVGVFAGCDQGGSTDTKSADTNAPAAPASTNK